MMMMMIIIIIIALLGYQTLYQEIVEENAPEIALLVAVKTAEVRERNGAVE
jgi:predicted ABC-type exoprotein transport system permease subunit